LGTFTSRQPEKAIEVEVVADVAARTGRSRYDLVKIDVEGAEFEVLETLSVQTRYFWLELSGRRFGGNSHHTSEVFDLIRRRFGEFDVLFQSRWSANTVCDVLLEIIEPRPGA
jgi:hypothetical protein